MALADAEPSTLRVHLFGPFEIEGFRDGDLGSRKARVFLKAVALGRDHPVPLDRLVDIVWGDRPPARPSDQLSVLASRLRKVLGADRIERAGGGYRLRADWFDLDEVEQLAVDASLRQSSGSAAAARAAAGAALRLARGVLLADEPDAEWLDGERRAAARLVSRLTTVAASAELDGGDPAAASVLAAQVLDTDPYDEAALRLLMQAYRASGRPASALAAYAEVRERLRDELGVNPTAETEALHTEILLVTDEPAPPAEPGRSAPALPGRADELARLDAELARARSGHARVVLVDGEAGIGKSTLLDRWRDGIEGSVVVVAGHCDEYSAELPLQAVVDALAGHLDRLDPDQVARLLGEERDALDPLLGRARPDRVPAAGDIGQSILFASLLTVLGRLSRPHGLVLLIDDFHFAGPSTRHWMRFVQRRGGRLPLLVVVASRDSRDDGVEADETIELQPLDLAAATEIVGADRAAELLERSGGHPLFLVELAAASPDELEAPSSIRAAIARRLRQVGPARDAILTAAVLGPTDLELIAAAMDRPPVDVLDDLEVAAREGFLDEHGAAYTFRHTLVRDALTAEVSSARHAWLHRKAAALLDARRPRRDLAEIVHHARLGGETTLAARALTGTAELAMARYAYDEAIRSLDEAVALDDDVEARLLRGRARIARSDFAGAMDDARRAIDLGGGAAGYELAARAGYLARDLAQAEADALQGARLADDPVMRASCLTIAGRVVHGQGDLATADRRLSEAFEIAGPGSPTTTGVYLARLRIHQSRDQEALGLTALTTMVERDPVAATFRLIAIAHALGHLGRPTEALDRLDELERLMEEIGARRYDGPARNWRGWLLRYLGALDAAAEHSESALDISRAAGFNEGVAHALLDQADLALLRGDLAAAEERLARAAPYDELDHPIRWRHTLRGRLLRAHHALMVGDDLGRAGDESLAVVAMSAELGIERFRVLGGLVAVMAAARPPADLDELVARLPSVAGTEAWWWLARLDIVTGDDRWRAAAEQAVSDLLPRAGEHRDQLATFATSMITRGR